MDRPTNSSGDGTSNGKLNKNTGINVASVMIIKAKLNQASAFRRNILEK